MPMIQLVRLGRDAETRYLPDGQPVVNLACAYNYGKKDASGNRPTQWLDAAFWGERAVKLLPWLVKGAPLVLTLEDVNIQQFKRNDGTLAAKLVGRVLTLEFAGKAPEGVGDKPRATASAAPAAGAPAPAAAAPAPATVGDFDDEIPF